MNRGKKKEKDKYEIRDDVKFSDGTQMTADDVVFSLNFRQI